MFDVGLIWMCEEAKLEKKNYRILRALIIKMTLLLTVILFYVPIEADRLDDGWDEDQKICKRKSHSLEYILSIVAGCIELLCQSICAYVCYRLLTLDPSNIDNNSLDPKEFRAKAIKCTLFIWVMIVAKIITFFLILFVSSSIFLPLYTTWAVFFVMMTFAEFSWIYYAMCGVCHEAILKKAEEAHHYEVVKDDEGGTEMQPENDADT